MTTPIDLRVLPGDRQRLRELGSRLLEIAKSPANERRRQDWLRHNALRGERPMIFTEISGLLQSGELSFASQFRCSEQWARDVEGRLMAELYVLEQVCDDSACRKGVKVIN